MGRYGKSCDWKLNDWSLGNTVFPFSAPGNPVSRCYCLVFQRAETVTERWGELPKVTQWGSGGAKQWPRPILSGEVWPGERASHQTTEAGASGALEGRFRAHLSSPMVNCARKGPVLRPETVGCFRLADLSPVAGQIVRLIGGGGWRWWEGEPGRDKRQAEACQAEPQRDPAHGGGAVTHLLRFS